MNGKVDITEEFMNAPELTAEQQEALAKAKAAFEEWAPSQEVIDSLSYGRDTDEVEERGLKTQKKMLTRGLSYSNSPLVNFTLISPNRNVPRQYSINRITPHCVVGQASVEALGYLFYNPGRQASSNYGIGADGRVGMYCPESDRSWCSSSWDNDQQSVTVECASDSWQPFAVNHVVFEKLVELCYDICKRNGKTKLLWFGNSGKALSYQPKDDEMVLTAHRWFASTICPGDYLYNRFGELARRVTEKFGGLHGGGSEWYYYRDGKIDYSKTGLVQNDYGWWYVRNGKVDFNYYGIVQNEYGWWRVEGGKVNFGCNTVEQNENGWFKCKNGKVDFKFTGLAPNKNGWWYCRDGKVDFTKYGIVQNDQGWWRVEKGKVNFDCNTVEQNENGWFKCKDGKVDFTFTGLAQNRNGWWYCRKGEVDFKKYGIVQNNQGWWRVEAGKVNFGCNTVEQNENGWWKCKDGKVDFTFTGIGENKNGKWYCKNGKVDFEYSGEYIEYLPVHKTYVIEKGKVVEEREDKEENKDE